MFRSLVLLSRSLRTTFSFVWEVFVSISSASSSRNFSQLTQMGCPSWTMSTPICESDWPKSMSVTGADSWPSSPEEWLSSSSESKPNSLSMASFTKTMVLLVESTIKGVGRYCSAENAASAALGSFGMSTERDELLGFGLGRRNISAFPFSEDTLWRAGGRWDRLLKWAERDFLSEGKSSKVSGPEDWVSRPLRTVGGGDFMLCPNHAIGVSRCWVFKSSDHQSYTSRTGCHNKGPRGKGRRWGQHHKIIGGLQSLARVFAVGNMMWCSVDMQHSWRDKATDFGGGQLWGGWNIWATWVSWEYKRSSTV